MRHQWHCVFEAVNWTLRGIRSIDAPFGGIPTLPCGNFPHILPVVRNGTRGNIVDASLKHLYLGNPSTSYTWPPTWECMEYLLSIGDGTYPLTELPNVITVPEFISCTATFREMKWKYIQIFRNKDEKWLSERAILAPLHDIVNRINVSLIQWGCHHLQVSWLHDQWWRSCSLSNRVSKLHQTLMPSTT